METTTYETSIVCGVCGLRAPMTEETMDAWHPEVWGQFPDGSEREVSPVCDNHTITVDADGVSIIKLA